MDNQIKVTITGDTGKLDQSLKNSEKSVSSFGSALDKAKKELSDQLRIVDSYKVEMTELKNSLEKAYISQSQFDKSVERLKKTEKEASIETKRLQKNIMDLERSQKTAVGSSKSLNKVNGNATNTLVEFGRVIQDAPYGIRGVANNIQQLTTNFGYLKKQAGGTVPALKAMVGSLAGPAGILIAVSAVTSLMVAFGDSLFSTSKDAEKLNDKLDSLNDSFDAELALNKEQERSLELQGKSTDSILASRKEIIKSQIESLKGLIQQQSALLETQKIENSRVTTWEAFVAIAKDLFNSFLSFAKDVGDVYSTLISTGVKVASVAVDKLSKSFVGNLLPGVQKFSDVLDSVNAKLDEKKKLNQASESDQKKENDLQNKLNELKTQELALANDLLEIDKKRNSGATKRGPVTGVSELKSSVIEPINIPVSASIEGLDSLSNELNIFQNKILAAKTTSEVAASAIGGAFSGLASVITSSLQTGNAVLDGFLSSLTNALTQIASNLAAQAIMDKIFASKKLATNLVQSNANAITIATSAAAALGPAGVVALPGLIGSQLALVNGAFSGISAGLAFAQGGIVPGGSFSGDKIPAMVNSGEMILNSRQQSNLFSMLNGNLGKIGAAETPTVQVEGSLRGSNIRLANLRAGRKNKRYSA